MGRSKTATRLALAVLMAAAGVAGAFVLSAPARAASEVSHAYLTGGVYSGTAGEVFWEATCETQLVGAPDVEGTCFTFGELAGSTRVDIKVTDAVAQHVAAEAVVWDPSRPAAQGPPHYFCDSLSDLAMPTGDWPATQNEIMVIPLNVTDGGPCGGAGVPTTGVVSVTPH